MGKLEARFALLPHGSRGEETIALVERIADDFLLPLRGFTLRSALASPAPTTGVELVLDEHDPGGLDGLLAFSACKPAENGDGIILRCINLADRTLRARWRIGAPISEALLARMDETPITKLAADGRGIPFAAAPRAVTTVIAHVTPPSVPV